MARVFAVFYRDGLPFSAFEGDEEQFELNKDAPAMPWRIMTGTQWGAITKARYAPSLEEFDAWRAANPPPEDAVDPS
jgi:hypothetical protein